MSQLFALVECDEFKMIRRPHIIFITSNDVFDLEKSDDNNEPEDADRKYVTDVFKAFPDVYFTVEHFHNISIEKAIPFQKKYQNVVFRFESYLNRDSKAFSRHLE